MFRCERNRRYCGVVTVTRSGYWVGLHASRDKCIRLFQRQSLGSRTRHVGDLVGDPIVLVGSGPVRSGPVRSGPVRSGRSSGIWPLRDSVTMLIRRVEKPTVCRQDSNVFKNILYVRLLLKQKTIAKHESYMIRV